MLIISILCENTPEVWVITVKQYYACTKAVNNRAKDKCASRLVQTSYTTADHTAIRKCHKSFITNVASHLWIPSLVTPCHYLTLPPPRAPFA